MKNILIYGLGSVSGVVASLFQKNNKLFVTNSFKFENNLFNKTKYLSKNEHLKNIKINYNLVIKWYKDSKFNIPINLWNKEKIDLILCGIKLNGINKFYNFIIKNNLIKSPVLFIQNGIGFEPQYFLSQLDKKNQDYSDKPSYSKLLQKIEYYRFIILFNASKDIFKNTIFWNTKGKIIIPENFLFKYPEYFNVKNNYINNDVSSIFVEVDDITPYVYRKLWLNTTNGFLSVINFSLKQVFYYETHLKYFIKFLKETQNLFKISNTKTLKLPALDPIDLINIGEQILNFLKNKFIFKNNFEIIKDKNILKNKITIIKYTLYKFIFKLNRFYFIKKLILTPFFKKNNFYTFIDKLPDTPNSTLQSLKNINETEYKFISEPLIKIANKSNLLYNFNSKIKNFIYNFEKGKYYKPVSIDRLIRDQIKK